MCGIASFERSRSGSSDEDEDEDESSRSCWNALGWMRGVGTFDVSWSGSMVVLGGTAPFSWWNVLGWRYGVGSFERSWSDSMPLFRS